MARSRSGIKKKKTLGGSGSKSGHFFKDSNENINLDIESDIEEEDSEIDLKKLKV